MSTDSSTTTQSDRDTSRPVGVGDVAPDFTLPDQHGSPIALHDLLGKGPLVVYFYPKDESTGCTAEACSFRDSYEVFSKAGAEVVGVSGDSSESHLKFAQHHRLPFLLLSDGGNKLRKQYGVPTTFGLIPGRVTYILDRNGVVRHMFSSQAGYMKHVNEALRIVEELSQEVQQQ